MLTNRNRKSLFQKIVKSIAFSIVLLFSICSSVQAENVDSKSGSTITGSSCSKGCWVSLDTKKDKALRAMRISLIYTNGTRVSGSRVINAMSETFAEALMHKTGYYYFGNGNKATYSISGVKPTKKQKNTSGTMPSDFNIINTSDLKTRYFSKVSTVDIDSKINSFQLDDIWNSIEGIDTEKFIGFVSELFLVDKTLVETYYENMWIVIEPVTYIRYGTEYYLGTFHELSSYSGIDFYSSALQSVIGRKLPCAAMITGTIANTNTNVPGVVNGSYFNGKLIPVNKSISNYDSICSSSSRSYFKKDAVKNSSNGIGVSLVWVGKHVSKTSCSMVESAIPALKGITLENLNKYPELITYTKDGKNYSISRDWYKDECTCYSLYEQYQKDKSVDMKNLSKNNIEQLFQDNTSYFTNYKKQLTEKYKENQNAGAITPWTYQKYTNLKCSGILPECASINFNEIDYQYGGLDCPELPLYGDPNFTFGYIFKSRYYYKNMTLPEPEKWSIYEENRYGIDVEVPKDYQNLISRNDENYFDGLRYLYGHRTIYVDYDYDVYYNVGLYKRCFNAYNQKYKTSWSISKYLNAGCAPGNYVKDFDDDPESNKKGIYNCTPQYNVGTCIDRDSVYYSDSASDMTEEEYWQNCIFNPNEDEKRYDITVHKTSQKTDVNTYYDDIISTKYCEVYCTETMTTNFDDKTIKVQAGRNFVWDNHVASETRTCKTKNFEYEQFLKDLDEANQDIIDAYVAWQLEIKLDNVKWEKSDEKDCAEKCSKCPTPEGGTTSCPPCHYTKYTYTPSSSKEEYSAYTQGANYSATDSKRLSSKCGGIGYHASPSKKEKEYKNAVAYAESLVQAIKQCYDENNEHTWTNHLLYNKKKTSNSHFNPEAIINYSDDYYNYSGDMDVYIRATNIYNNSIKDVNKEGVLQMISCKDGICKTKDPKVQNYKIVSMTQGATAYFDLQDDIYGFIDKETHISTHRTISENDLGRTYNYVQINHSNFPVAFSTQEGTYGEGQDRGKLSLNYSKLGYLKNNSTAVDRILGSVSSDYKQWNCKFKVTAGIIPEVTKCKGSNCDGEGDIILIYRPIDLHNPFPDIDSKGRETGSNWCGTGDNCSNDPNKNDTVKAVITNNRGVEEEKIYSEEPMYVFTLTPATLKEIRRYNNANNYASYTGKLDGKIFDFVCDKGTARNCKSEYLWYMIHTLIPSKSNKAVTGSCSKEQRFNTSTDNTSRFEQCRAINNSFYLAR